MCARAVWLFIKLVECPKRERICTYCLNSVPAFQMQGRVCTECRFEKYPGEPSPLQPDVLEAHVHYGETCDHETSTTTYKTPEETPDEIIEYARRERLEVENHFENIDRQLEMQKDRVQINRAAVEEATCALIESPFQLFLSPIQQSIVSDNTWIITSFTQCQRKAVDGIQSSECSYSFHDSQSEYSFDIRIIAYLNGDGIGQGTHLSFFVKSDHSIQQPTVTISLINPKGHDHARETITLQKNQPYKIPQFISLELLKNFIKDDSIQLRLILKNF